MRLLLTLTTSVIILACASSVVLAKSTTKYQSANFSNLNVNRFSFIDDNVKVTVSNLKVPQLNSSSQENNAHIKVANIDIQAQKGNAVWQQGEALMAELKAADGKLNYDFKFERPFWYGKQRLTLNSLSIRNYDINKHVTFDKVEIHSAATKRDTKTNFMLKLHAHKIDNEVRTLGPFDFNAKITGLDTKALAMIIKQQTKKSRRVKRQRAQNMKPNNPMKPVLTLVSSGFKVAMQAALTSSDGTLNAKATLKFPHSKDVYPNISFVMLAAQAKVHAQAPKLMLKNMIANFAMENTGSKKISKKAAQAAASKQIAHMLKAHWLVSKGNKYVFDLSYNGGALLLNGKPPAGVHAKNDSSA